MKPPNALYIGAPVPHARGQRAARTSATAKARATSNRWSGGEMRAENCRRAPDSTTGRGGAGGGGGGGADREVRVDRCEGGENRVSVRLQSGSESGREKPIPIVASKLLLFDRALQRRRGARYLKTHLISPDCRIHTHRHATTHRPTFSPLDARRASIGHSLVASNPGHGMTPEVTRKTNPQVSRWSQLVTGARSPLRRCQ